MLRRKIISGMVIVFSITVFAGENSSDKSKSEMPEYSTDFEDQQQTIPMQMPNEFQGRMNRQMAEQWSDFSNFTRSRQRSLEQRIMEMQRKAREQEEQAMKQALGVNEAQWKTIKPKIEKVKTCRERASVSTGLPLSSTFVSSTSSPQGGGGFGGGFQFQSGGSSNLMPVQSSFQNQPSQRETQGERICRELNELLDNPNSSPEAIRQKMLELQQARANAKRQLAQAQKELREVLTLRQQARLVLIGLLD
ncbi:MAG: hypothetical protein JW715_16945 [Sedimentisphaerales bacterium]|nr:hypothetical protein [Sedimentisphaerales bacterium]